MARATAFGVSSATTDEIIAARTITGTVTADNSSLTDANIPPAGAVNCRLYDTVFVGAEITGGTAPNVTVELLFRDAEAADGSRWARLLTGVADGVTLAAGAAQTTGTLTNGSSFVELRVFGAKSVYPRVTAVANGTGTTGATILMMGGKARNVANIPR